MNLPHSYIAVSLMTESLLLASEGIGGVGKSIAMLQTVVEARRRGWLVLYIPDGKGGCLVWWHLPCDSVAHVVRFV